MDDLWSLRLDRNGIRWRVSCYWCEDVLVENLNGLATRVEELSILFERHECRGDE